MNVLEKCNKKLFLVVLSISFLISFIICNFFLIRDISASFQNQILQQLHAKNLSPVNPNFPKVVWDLNDIYESLEMPTFFKKVPFLHYTELCYKNFTAFRYSGLLMTPLEIQGDIFRSLGAINVATEISYKNPDQSIYTLNYIPSATKRCIPVDIARLTSVKFRIGSVFQLYGTDKIVPETNYSEMFLWHGYRTVAILTIILFLSFSLLIETALGILHLYYRK